MRLAAPFISELRLQRYHRWALLWLTWFAVVLDAVGAHAPLSRQAHTIAHRWLDRIERVVVKIIFLRAVEQLHLPRRRRVRSAKLPRAGLYRVMMGAHLRRLLRSKDLRTRIAALRQDLAPLVNAYVKRVPRGFTRLFAIIPRPQTCSVAPSDTFVASQHAFDSS